MHNALAYGAAGCYGCSRIQPKGGKFMEQVQAVPLRSSVHEFPVHRDGVLSDVVRVEVESETGSVRVTTTGDVTIVRPFTIAGLFLRDYRVRESFGRPNVAAEPDGGLVIGVSGPLQEVSMQVGQHVWPVRSGIRAREEDFVVRLEQRASPPRFDFSAGYRQTGIQRIGSQILLHITLLE